MSFLNSPMAELAEPDPSEDTVAERYNQARHYKVQQAVVARVVVEL